MRCKAPVWSHVLALAAVVMLSLAAAPLAVAQAEAGMRGQDYTSQRYTQSEWDTDDITDDRDSQSEASHIYGPSRWQDQMSNWGADTNRSMRADSMRNDQFSQSADWRDQRAFTAATQFGTRVSGEIERLAYVNLDDITHVFAKIDTDQGRSVMTYLGQADQIERLNLNLGDRVTVYGRPDVLEAVAVEANGQQVALNTQQSAFTSRMARSGQTGAHAEVRGQIENLRTERMADRTHLIADVRTNRGQYRTIDLGPLNKLSRLDLNEGDQITVTGFQQSFRGQRLIKAREVEANGQFIRTSSADMAMRDGQSARSAADMDSTKREKQCGGEIIRLQHASFAGLNEDHLVGTLRDGNSGKMVKVDFGPLSEAHAINLRLGDFVHVKGERGRIEDENAILAKTVNAEGQTFHIDQDTTQKMRKMETSAQTRY